MIDILVYLFETYGYADACPNEPDQLARKLSAAGFEEADISEALEWLSDLRSTVKNTFLPATTDTHSFRIYSDEENARLDVASRGFLMFLCSTGIVTPEQRERILDRALALSLSEVSVSEFKVVVLMVLWQDDAQINGLVLDELMTEELEEGQDYDDQGRGITVH